MGFADWGQSRMIKSKHIIILILVFVIVIFTGNIVANSVTLCQFVKADINKASIEDLEKINGIGEFLSKEIYRFCLYNPVQSVDELEGHIKYLGPKRIELLKKYYR